MDEDFWSVELGKGLGDLRLGTSRRAVLRHLENLGVKMLAPDDEPNAFGVDDDFMLTFSATATQVLLQIEADDQRIHFGSKRVIGCRLHEITDLLQVEPAETVWRTETEPEDSLPGIPWDETEEASNEELLNYGTLWLLPFGVGLRLDEGEIAEVYLRLPEHVPQQGLGRLTPQQVELSRRSDLKELLDRSTTLTPKPRGYFNTLLTLACVGLIGNIVWQGTLLQRRWNDAPKVEANVVSVRPEAPDQIPTEYVIEYPDSNGRPQRAVLGLADVSIPRNVGETIAVRYLPEDPLELRMEGRAHDVAFRKYFPRVIMVAGAYVVLLIVGAIVKRLARG